jgi:hypothetical protein
MVDLITHYKKYGYCVLDAFDSNEFLALKEFTNDWVKSVIQNESGINLEKYDLGQYHKWSSELGIKHDGIFAAKNRYIDPPRLIKDITHNIKVMNLLNGIHNKGYIQWADPGLGWFGYRLIRPSMGDGYPTSCKNWGAAAGVVSIWAPIIGFSKNVTLSFIPGSHTKSYERYLPDDQKFTKGELRLNQHIDKSEYKQLDLSEGQIIIYHPALLHTENVENGDITRINLEYRFMPKN